MGFRVGERPQKIGIHESVGRRAEGDPDAEYPRKKSGEPSRAP
jgi:hypothetical protein